MRESVERSARAVLVSRYSFGYISSRDLFEGFVAGGVCFMSGILGRDLETYYTHISDCLR